MSKITLEQLRGLLSYDPDNGLFTWTVSPNRRIKAGSIAGTTASRGYWCIKLLGKRYYAHRLAWLYSTGHWPSLNVDHINRVKTDNRLCNLRDVTCAVNSGNTHRTKTDYPGISWSEKRGKWRVYMRIGGARVDFGYFKSLDSAIELFKSKASGDNCGRA